jgi:D-alanine-D-alanine ligase
MTLTPTPTAYGRAPSGIDGRMSLSDRMRALAQATLEEADSLELIFVTNLTDQPPVDLGPEGVLNHSQYYTRRQAEGIIRAFQSLGVTVSAYFSERDFIAAATSGQALATSRRPVVFTTAEGGSGSGRRALIPALCQLLSIPVLNSGAHACSLARHKFHANAVLHRVGVRAPETWQFTGGSWVGGSAPRLGERVILKRAWESMCIGVDEHSVQTVGSEFACIVAERERRFAQPAIVQAFITGEEIGVPLARIGGTTYALPPVAFRDASGTPFGARPRTFRDEAVEHNVSLVAVDGPAHLGAAAVAAFDALEMSGVGRIDFRVDADGRAWAFDTNESPPPLPGTSYATAMEELGFTFEEMLAMWLGVCLQDAGVLSGV